MQVVRYLLELRVLDRGDVTDLEMPADGTEGHFTLLIADFLAKRIREERSIRVGIGELHEHAFALVREHAGHWRILVREPGAEDCLVADAIERLEGLRLIARGNGGGVIPRPAIARYRIGDIQESTSAAAAGADDKFLWISEK